MNFSVNDNHTGHTQWCVSIILTLARLRQQDQEFDIFLGYIESLRLAYYMRLSQIKKITMIV